LAVHDGAKRREEADRGKILVDSMSGGGDGEGEGGEALRGVGGEFERDHSA